MRFYNKTLNKQFWSEDKKFDPEIRDKLLVISQDFIENLDLEDVAIHDITLTGSNSNYNYNQYSDLDVHILIDFKDINDDEELVKTALDGQRFIWNLRHNINLNDHDVELYMQDKDEPHVASGLFSLRDNEWIVEPNFEEPSIDKRDVYKKARAIQKEVQILKNKVKEARGKEARELHNRGNELKEKIGKMRKAGLDREGEFSVENLAFKVLRNTNVIETLIDEIAKSYDKIFMENFKTFFEYFQGNPIMNPHMRNGKNPNSVGPTKKHLNTLPKKYAHKCPHVRSLVTRGGGQILLMGQPLFDSLGKYDVQYAPGQVKTLGNSGVHVKMYDDEEGNQCGRLEVK